MYNQITSNKRKTALLIALFVVIVMFIGWTFSRLTDTGYPGLFLAGIIAIGMSIGGYYAGDKLALAAAGAKGPINKNDNPYLYRIVENLTITAGLPMPKVYIIPDAAINAFATGRDPAHASIAVTTGAAEKLANEELEGVIAHELSHIKNYDIRLMTVVLVLVGLLALLSDWFIRMRLWGGGKRDERGDGRIQGILMIVGLVLIILAPMIGQLIKLAVSRRREFLADASAALITRYPEGLASALEKIAAENTPLKRANNATAHLYIANPFGNAKHFLANMFSTHPPITERVKTLRQMI